MLEKCIHFTRKVLSEEIKLENWGFNLHRRGLKSDWGFGDWIGRQEKFVIVSNLAKQWFRFYWWKREERWFHRIPLFTAAIQSTQLFACESPWYLAIHFQGSHSRGKKWRSRERTNSASGNSIGSDLIIISFRVVEFCLLFWGECKGGKGRRLVKMLCENQQLYIEHSKAAKLRGAYDNHINKKKFRCKNVSPFSSWAKQFACPCSIS